MFTRTAIAEIAPQRLKNSGGATRLLANGPHWRVSLAEVCREGPISIFEGMQRHSVVVGGDGLQLECGDAMVHLSPGTVAAYAGDLPWRCTLAGRTATVFNVMCEVGHAKAIVEITRDRLELAHNADTLVLFPVDCSVRVEIQCDGAAIIRRGEIALASLAQGIACSVEDGTSGFLVAVRLQLCGS